LPKPTDITGLILAGGRGSRMDGADKGLQTLNGMPLALHVLTRLRLGGGVNQIMINANRNLAAYASLGTPVWPDTLADHAGPLAGFLTGLAHCETPFLLTVPCDTPLLPLDLALRLARALEAENADIAMAGAPAAGQDGQRRIRAQPVFCLLRMALRQSLAQFIQGGGRKVGAWSALHKTVLVPFDLPDDDPRAFFNVNTLAELRQLEIMYA
jgi:molybdopterin-guanine dinucleotide biosynthesis protein A, proteobacterial